VQEKKISFAPPASAFGNKLGSLRTCTHLQIAQGLTSQKPNLQRMQIIPLTKTINYELRGILISIAATSYRVGQSALKNNSLIIGSLEDEIRKSF